MVGFGSLVNALTTITLPSDMDYKGLVLRLKLFILSGNREDCGLY